MAKSGCKVLHPAAAGKGGGPGSVFHFSLPFGVAGTKVSATPVVPVAEQSDSRAWRTLLAEDNVINQRLAIGLLEKYGHIIEVANNGREARDAFRRGSFDLVLMDVQMPEMNGFEATQTIRERDRVTGKHTPIIAMTAYALERVAHTLKGALGYFGPSSALSATLELHQRGTRRDLSNARETLTQLESGLVDLKTSLSEIGKAYAL